MLVIFLSEKRFSKIPQKYVYAMSISTQKMQNEATGFNILSPPQVFKPEFVEGRLLPRRNGNSCTVSQ